MRKTSTEILISRAYKEQKYQGKHIIVIGDKIHARKTGKASAKLLEKLLKRYPKETPSITYIPKEDTILLSNKAFLYLWNN